MKAPSLFVPFLLVCAVITFESATDLFIPSLPEITLYYGVDESIGQMTLSAYLLGFSLLGVLSGPLSDSYGRRSVFLLGILVFTMGSMSCAFSVSMLALITSRFIQGLGAGISYVIAAAIIKDSYPEHTCSKIFSLMAIAVTLSPTIAPIIGGIIAHSWGWPSIFQIILFVSIATLILLLIALPESLPEKSRAPFSLKNLMVTYGELLANKRILGYSLISGITFGGLWAWIAEAPFYFINQLNMSSLDYSYYAAIGPAAYILGSTINQKFVNHFGVDGLFRWGLTANALGSFLLLVVTYQWSTSVIAIYTTLSIYAIGIAVVFPNSCTRAVDVPAHQRGAASALLSTIEMACAATSALLIGYISNQTLVPPTIVILSCALACTLIYSWIRSPTQKLSEIP
jgi:DHA1 family bicyclomycin/chloramphenicol resistance-like MFS transporter